MQCEWQRLTMVELAETVLPIEENAGARQGRGVPGRLSGLEVTHLFPHFPHALHTMEQVAAPQQLAAKDTS